MITTTITDFCTLYRELFSGSCLATTTAAPTLMILNMHESINQGYRCRGPSLPSSFIHTVQRVYTTA